MRSEFTVMIEDGGDGWFWEHSPEVPAASGQGRTPEEAKEDLAAAIELVFADLREEAERQTPPDAIREILTLG